MRKVFSDKSFIDAKQLLFTKNFFEVALIL